MWRSLYKRAARTGDERGQMVVLAAFSMVAMLAIAALAIDIGLLTHDRRDLQNGADAMALAGASQIKADGTANDAARSVAMTWATKNDVSNAEVTSISFGRSCDGDATDDSITVRLTRSRNTTLAGIIGIRKGSVSVCSTAARFSLGGGIGMAPFAVDRNCIFGTDGLANTADDNFHSGSITTIKWDSQNDAAGACGSNSGNFWTLAIDATGDGSPCGFPEPADTAERKLKQAICFGAITPLCVASVAASGEDCDDTVDTEPGNNIGAVNSSVQFLVNNVPADCNTLAEIIGSEVINGSTKYYLKDKCNPFLPGYTGVSLVKMIPVLTNLSAANGRTNLSIYSFLIVVIDPSQVTGKNWCKGNSCDLKAEIVDIGVDPDMLRASLNDNSSNNFSVLVN